MYKFTGILLSIFLSLLLVDTLYFEKYKPNQNKRQIQNIEENNITIIDILGKDNSLNTLSSEAVDYLISTKENNKTKNIQKKISKHKRHKKAKKHKKFKNSLLIIMDDISTIKEAKLIKNLKLNITPSIFPKTSTHPNTPKIAKMFKFVMMHLPMEAKNWKKPEEITLNTSDSKKTLKQKLHQDLKGFSNIIAINNHTGSKFTEDKKRLKYIITLLHQKHIFFIDSKTTNRSKYIEIQRELGKKILQRDIFLDNIQEISYIKNQIKKAVRLAKKNGFAIAICHPHFETFKALNQSRQLLKSVRLVNINELRD